MKELVELTSFLADALTILASSIAIYIFFFKGKYLITVFNTLVNYSTQLTLSELKEKLDILNNLRASDEKDREEIVNVFSDITGQLNGNPKLKPHFAEVINRIVKNTASKAKVTEPWKRALVSEIREKIRHVGIITIEEMSGENNE